MSDVGVGANGARRGVAPGRSSRLVVRVNTTALVALAVLPALFVSDVILGASRMLGIELAVTPGVIARGGLFVMCLGFVVAQLRNVALRDAALLMLVLVSGLLGPVGALIAGGDIHSFLGDVQSLTKVVYWPVITFAGALWFYFKRDVDGLFLVRYTEIAFYALGVSLLAMNLAGATQLTYGEYAYGTKGVFHSQNDMSLVMGIALCAAVYMTLHRPGPWRIALLVMSMYALALIGTRASLVAILAGAPAVYVWVLMERRSSRMTMLRGVVLAVVAAIGLIVAANIGYLVVERMSQFEYSRQKLVFQMPREYLYEAAREYISDRPIEDDLLGEGNERYERGVFSYLRFGPSNGRKAAEIDWLDLHGAYGIIFTFLIYALFMVLLLRCLAHVRVSRDGVAGLHLIMFGLFLGHGVLAGHAFVSPIVGTVIGLAAARYVRVRRRGSLGPAGSPLVRGSLAGPR